MQASQATSPLPRSPALLITLHLCGARLTAPDAPHMTHLHEVGRDAAWFLSVATLCVLALLAANAGVDADEILCSVHRLGVVRMTAQTLPAPGVRGKRLQRPRRSNKQVLQEVNW